MDKKLTKKQDESCQTYSNPCDRPINNMPNVSIPETQKIPYYCEPCCPEQDVTPKCNNTCRQPQISSSKFVPSPHSNIVQRAQCLTNNLTDITENCTAFSTGNKERCYDSATLTKNMTNFTSEFGNFATNASCFINSVNMPDFTQMTSPTSIFDRGSTWCNLNRDILRLFGPCGGIPHSMPRNTQEGVNQIVKNLNCSNNCSCKCKDCYPEYEGLRCEFARERFKNRYKNREGCSCFQDGKCNFFNINPHCNYVCNRNCCSCETPYKRGYECRNPCNLNLNNPYH